MELLTFRYEQRIAYADCTIGNHVYYSRYLELLEVARGEFFRKLGHPLLALQSRGIAFPVSECRLRYREPARYDDVVIVELWLAQAKGARLHFGYRVLSAGASLLLEAETVHACATLDEKPRRMPEELLAAFQPYLRAEKAS